MRSVSTPSQRWLKSMPTGTNDIESKILNIAELSANTTVSPLCKKNVVVRTAKMFAVF